MGRRVDPALLLRRVERTADPGHERRDAVSPARRVAPRPHGLRRPDRRGQHGDVRQDAVGHLRGLPRGAADHHLGREPVRVRHSPRPVHPRSAAPRREARRRRSAHDAARQAGRHPPRGPARHGPARRACRFTVTSSRRATPTRHFSQRIRAAPSAFANVRRPWTFERAAAEAGVSTPTRCRAVAELYASTAPALVRCGWGQERNRNGGNSSLAIMALPAVGGQVRRARRRLHDEQLRIVGHHRDGVGSCPRSRRRASST